MPRGGWNRGLTRETDSRVAAIAKKVGRAHKGRTLSKAHREAISAGLLGVMKGVPKSIEHRRKISKTLRGDTPWNTGLRKETDERVANMGQSVKLAWANMKVNDPQRYLDWCDAIGENNARVDTYVREKAESLKKERDQSNRKKLRAELLANPNIRAILGASDIQRLLNQK